MTKLLKLPLRQESIETSSPALKTVLESLGDSWRHGVLDLGSAIGTNVEFFSRFSRKLTVADVFRALESKPTDKTADLDWDSIFAELLPHDEGTRFDLILAWDVLNYLDHSQIESLARQISRFCEQGSVLFALMATRKEIPARPRQYHIVQPEKLMYRSATQAIRPCPSYKEPDLCRWMPQFQVKSTFFLRNGMQEYLFTFTHTGETI